MIVKYAIANVNISALAHMAQDSGLDGSVYQGYGFGAWGVEPTVFMEFATSDIAKHDEFVRQVLAMYKETCALRIIDGKDAGLVYMSSIVEFA